MDLMEESLEPESSGSIQVHNRQRRSLLMSGFTMIEILVVLSILSLFLLIATPEVAQFNQNLNLERDFRAFTQQLGRLRRVALLTRNDVAVNFTTTGLRWDYGNDGSFEGSWNFQRTSFWKELSSSPWTRSVPDDFIFNGFGHASVDAGNALVIGISYDDSIELNQFIVSLLSNGFLRRVH